VTDIFIAGLEPVETCVPGEGYGLEGVPPDSLGAEPDTLSPLPPSPPVRPSVPFDTVPTDTLRLRPSPTRPPGTRRRPPTDTLAPLPPAPAAQRPSVPPPR
jgi:hypothetical protein